MTGSATVYKQGRFQPADIERERSCCRNRIGRWGVVPVTEYITFPDKGVCSCPLPPLGTPPGLGRSLCCLMWATLGFLSGQWLQGISHNRPVGSSASLHSNWLGFTAAGPAGSAPRGLGKALSHGLSSWVMSGLTQPPFTGNSDAEWPPHPNRCSLLGNRAGRDALWEK